jgi:hypothetical protein
MKLFIVATIFFSTSVSAQSLDLSTLKGLMTARKTILEKFNVGMTKRITGYNVAVYDDVPACKFKQVTNQSVIKIEAARALILSKVRNFPANTPACREAGFVKAEPESGSIFYISKPSLEQDLKDLDAMAANIKSISKTGEIVSIVATTEALNVTLNYDLTKPSFKNLVLSQDADSRSVTEDVADVDVAKLDLKKVSFCGVDEEGNFECTPEGDYSDILF